MHTSTLFGHLENKPSPKVQVVWGIGELFFCLGTVIGLSLIALFLRDADPTSHVLIPPLIALIVVCVVVWLIRLICIRLEYKFYSYEITKDYVQIQRGFIVKKRTVIPFVRVQDIETEQGPLMRMASLCDLKLSTASESHAIKGLPLAYAKDLREQAAELARLAREDV